MGLVSLALMSGCIFAATLATGHIPLMFNLSRVRLNQAAHFGRGLLIGAGLAIVIPEGTEAMWEHAPEGVEQSRYMAISLLSGFVFMYLVDSIHDRTDAHQHFEEGHSAELHNAGQLFRPELHQCSSQTSLIPSGRVYPPSVEPSPDLEQQQQHQHHQHSHNPSFSAPHRPSMSSAGYESRSGSRSASPTRSSSSRPPFLKHGEHDGDDYRNHSYSDIPAPLRPHKHLQDKPWHSSITLGLVIHSLADGISLGASALASAGVDGVNLSIIVFFAILVHKAPTALGLTSSLLAQSRTKSSVQRSLVLFSLASPFGAVLTYGVISLLSGGGLTGTESDRLMYWAGCSLLFSAGTFLFVATHAVPEQNEQGQHIHIGDFKRVILTCLGMCSPFLLQLLVGHSH